MSKYCPVCNSELNEQNPGPNIDYFSCPSCGTFYLTRSLQSILPKKLDTEKDSNVKISHAIRQMQQNNKAPTLNTDTIKKILERPLPRPKEQADLLIRWLAENIKGPGETVWVEYNTHGAIIGAKTAEGFDFVLKHLFDIGLVTGNLADSMDTPGRAIVTLSFSGWEYYEKLKLGGAIYRKGFMAMKFGDPTLDKIVSQIFKPSVEQAGFKLIKLDDILKAGLIDDRLRVEIQSSDFLVVDLTHDNHGAYWEAGYGEGLGKPVIYTCEKKKFETIKTHFDTNHHLTVIWDNDNPKEAGKALKATIRATLPHLAKAED